MHDSNGIFVIVYYYYIISFFFFPFFIILVLLDNLSVLKRYRNYNSVLEI